MNYSRILTRLFITGFLGILFGCSVTIPIDAWREKYPGDDIHSISETRDTNEIAENEIRELTLKRVEEFAQGEGMNFEVLEETKSIDTIQIPQENRAERLLTVKIIFRLIETER